jgi:hypothetical protein
MTNILMASESSGTDFGAGILKFCANIINVVHHINFIFGRSEHYDYFENVHIHISFEIFKFLTTSRSSFLGEGEKGISVPITGREGPKGCESRGSHIFSRQSAHRWRQGCQSYAPAAFYSPGRFLVRGC